MTRTEFDAAIQKICAAFVFPYPAEDTLLAWHQVAGGMDLRDSAWVVDAFIRRNGRITRGVNLGHELAALHAEYATQQLGQQYSAHKKQAGCEQCSRTHPGFFRVHIYAHGHEPESPSALFRCACNSEPQFAAYPAWTRAQILSYPFMEMLS